MSSRTARFSAAGKLGDGSVGGLKVDNKEVTSVDANKVPTV